MTIGLVGTENLVCKKHKLTFNIDVEFKATKRFENRRSVRAGCTNVT